MSTVSVESHKFSAHVVFEGRTKLKKPVTCIEPWELTINGNKLEPMTAADIAEATTQPKDTALDRFVTTMALDCNKFIKDAQGEDVDMHEFLWSFEIEHLKHLKCSKGAPYR